MHIFTVSAIICCWTVINAAEDTESVYQLPCEGNRYRANTTSCEMFKEIHNSRSRMSCGSVCLKTPPCFAFNFLLDNITISHEESGLCQLFPKTCPALNCTNASVSLGATYVEENPCFNGGTWDGSNCACAGSWIKPYCETTARDCTELWRDGRRHKKMFSMWEIQPQGASAPFPVLCILLYGGSTVIQRRRPLSDSCPYQENFYRSWADYKNGFGDLHCSFWLGNDKIHQITSQRNYNLEVVLMPPTFNGVHYQGWYSRFRVYDESTGYQVSTWKYMNSSYTTSTGDSMLSPLEPQYSIQHMQFSTYDRDNDNSESNCAADFQSGWWFNNCTVSNVNGVHSVLPNGSRDTSIPSIWWKYNWDNISIYTVDLRLKV